jgi:hypothetical protein
VNHPHWSTTVIGIVLVVVALAFYGLVVLYGAWIDGRRQRVRDKGKHPVTEGTGEVHAREDEKRRNG